jgi:hypothetical protein
MTDVVAAHLDAVGVSLREMASELRQGTLTDVTTVHRLIVAVAPWRNATDNRRGPTTPRCCRT